jgi:hypothetical protein
MILAVPFRLPPQYKCTQDSRPGLLSAVPRGLLLVAEHNPRTGVLGYFRPSLRDCIYRKRGSHADSEAPHLHKNKFPRGQLSPARAEIHGQHAVCYSVVKERFFENAWALPVLGEIWYSLLLHHWPLR